ncbi:hypothetical protein NDU88_000618 [Pleurodeles waltl]|uniref:Uncharacterized protein n=1 Tax=Pleurodeles waltl TaxID=8319 RepID=A0AAV7S547_PLEWA|nr:hypothetical protein NDU88_000618 [Pleurodeles waltl]
MPDLSTVLAAVGSAVLIVPSHLSPFLGLHSVQDVPMAGYPVSPPLSGLRVCPISYAAHLFASDATAVAAADLSRPRPPSRCHPASPPGPLHTSNPDYVGLYWCVQRRYQVSHAPGRCHGVPLGRLPATTRILSHPDDLERPYVAPEARRRRPPWLPLRSPRVQCRVPQVTDSRSRSHTWGSPAQLLN